MWLKLFRLILLLNVIQMLIFTKTLAASVKDKIGDKGMDSIKIVNEHILDKIDEMVPDEVKNGKRPEDVVKLIKGVLDTPAAAVPIS